MARDLLKELDELKANVLALSRTVAKLAPAGGAEEKPERVAPEPESDKYKRVAPLARELRQKALASGNSGMISYGGYYGGGADDEYFWGATRSVDSLLGIADEKVAQVLSALGSKERLALLKAILAQPASVAELVEKTNMGSTGQVYHHLNILQAADLIIQKQRGIYAFQPHRVQSLLMLLCGVEDALSEKYSSGTWDGSTKPGEEPVE